MRTARFILASGILALNALHPVVLAQTPSTDLILFNGKVFTSNASQRRPHRRPDDRDAQRILPGGLRRREIGHMSSPAKVLSEFEVSVTNGMWMPLRFRYAA